MSYDLEQRALPAETIHEIAAAYPNSAVAGAVVAELLRAGLAETDVTVMHPWPVEALADHDRLRSLDQPWLALVSGVAMGGIASVGALLWANPDHWMVYGALGMLLGVLSGSVAGALSATSPPHWHDQKLGDPLGATTVEVRTTDPGSAWIANRVMALHQPTLITARVEPGERPPTERVLWEHPSGLSPLEVLAAWRRGELPPRQARARRALREQVMWEHPQGLNPLQVFSAWLASGSLVARLGAWKTGLMTLRRRRGRHVAERQGWPSARPWRVGQDRKILGRSALSQTGERRLPPRDKGRHSTRPRPERIADLGHAFDRDPVGINIVLAHHPASDDGDVEIEIDHLTGVRR